MNKSFEHRRLDKDQLAVMVRLSQDMSQQQIADDMGKSLSWVQKTVRSIKDHYGVDSLPALIALFVEEAPDYRFFDPDKEERTEPYNIRTYSRRMMLISAIGLALVVVLASLFAD